MPNELSRRSALRGAMVVVPAALVGYVVSRRSDAASRRTAGTGANGYGPSTQPGGRRLAGLAQIPVGGGLIMRHDGIVLIKEADGSVQGFSATCTHQGCQVSSVSGGTINCPCHGSRFDVTNGHVVAGPATTALPAIPVTVHDGGVYTT